MIERGSHPVRQQGAVAPMVAGALVAILGIAALALDLGNAYVNKGLLQNSLDAAALSSAKVLDMTGDLDAARAEANTVFVTNAQAVGNSLWSAVNDDSLQLVVEFSDTLVPFTPTNTQPVQYVRVRVNELSVRNWFARVVGVEALAVGGSAVAGPSPSLVQVCNVAPVMACANSESEGEGDYYGYTIGELVQLKSSAGEDSDVGPGNFQLIRLEGASGANDLRHALAGSYDACINLSDDIETEPGNTTGPVAQGINTRLGIYQPPLRPGDYPPDVITEHPGYRYQQYVADLADPTAAVERQLDGVEGRRLMAVPLGDCTGTATGHDTVPLLGFGCFFLSDKAEQQGNQSTIHGEFTGGCQIQGVPGPTPGGGPGPYIIQLYEDPGSIDS